MWLIRTRSFASLRLGKICLFNFVSIEVSNIGFKMTSIYPQLIM